MIAFESSVFRRLASYMSIPREIAHLDRSN